MIETGLVYIYSISPARAFKGCGALLEGGYVATCRHVWRIAAPAGQPPEVEIEFPFGTKEKAGGGDKYVVPARRARLADACEVLDGTAPDLVFLALVEPRSHPSGVMWLQPAAHERFETGAGFAHGGLIGRDKANPNRVSDVRVKGEIIDFIDSEGRRQFTGNNSASYWTTRGASGSPVFLEGGQQLAGIMSLSETGANEGETHLHEAFVVPATTIRKYLTGRLAADAQAEKWGIDPAKLQPILAKLGQMDVPDDKIAERLDASVEERLAQAAKPVPVSNDGADIDAAIVASRAKLRDLDTAGALDVLRAKLAEEERERTRRRVPLLKERAEVERLAFDYDAVKQSLAEVTRLAPDDVWAFINLGDIYVTTGPLEEAARAFCNAGEAARRQGDERELSVSQIKFGDIRMAKGDLKWASALYKAGLTIREALFRRDPTNTRSQSDLSVAYNKIGDVQISQVDLAGALKSYNDSLAITERLAKSDPGNARWQRDLSVAYERIGIVQEAQENLAGARKSYEDGLAIALSLARRGPANTEWQRDLSVSYEKIGDVLKKQDNLSGALTSYRVALDLREALMRRGPANTKWQRDLSVSQEKIADVLKAQGDLNGALISYRAALDLRNALARRDPANTEWQRDLSETRARIGEVLKAQGDLDEALMSYRAALDLRDALARPDVENMKRSPAALSLRETLLYYAALERKINEPNRPGYFHLGSSRSVFDLMHGAVDNPAQLSALPTDN